MRMKALPIIIGLTMLPVEGAGADSDVQFQFSGELLKHVCDNDPTACSSYIAGVTDADANAMWSFDTCFYALPDKISGVTLTMVVIDHLEAHPEEMKKSAYGAILRALKEAFPCSGIKYE